MKTAYQTALTLVALVTFSLSFGQSDRLLKPALGPANNFTKKDQTTWEAVLDKYAKIDAGTLDYEKLPAKDKARVDSLEMGYGPMTQGPGCSWYCGGQMYKVTSDSYLADQGHATYKPDNLHDFNLFTAWVADTTGGAIGKKIAFHFKPLSPRVEQIEIYNGYLKNVELFRANSRVKKFRLYINDVYYATLQLADTTALQTFKIDPVQSTDQKKDLVLTFEIIEIYNGDKYADVAVSEINFSGPDVH